MPKVLAPVRLLCGISVCQYNSTVIFSYNAWWDLRIQKKESASTLQNLSRSFRIHPHAIRWAWFCVFGCLFCVHLDVCFGSLSSQKIQLQTRCSFLPQAARFSFQLRVLHGVHNTMYPNKVPMAFGIETAPQHCRSSPIPNSGN